MWIELLSIQVEFKDLLIQGQKLFSVQISSGLGIHNGYKYEFLEKESARLNIVEYIVLGIHEDFSVTAWCDQVDQQLIEPVFIMCLPSLYSNRTLYI